MNGLASQTVVDMRRLAKEKERVGFNEKFPMQDLLENNMTSCTTNIFYTPKKSKSTKLCPLQGSGILNPWIILKDHPLCLVDWTPGVYPIGSMYGIYTYIYHKNQLNVGIYTIHGSYGYMLYIYNNIYIYI